MYCVPPNWNGDLVVWAHGYVDVTRPLGFYHLTFPDGSGGTVYLPDIIEGLSFAFATTSYRTNGLAVTQGVQDVEELVDAFPVSTGQSKPRHTYQTGASEGGLISALLAERSPERFSGALAACGPIGDFQLQSIYLGDMRIIFDYLFPGVLPGRPFAIPPRLIANWDTVYKPAVQRAIAAQPDLAMQMYQVVGSPVSPDPARLDATALDVLWYNVFATNDARRKLHGNPYDNSYRWYAGSTDDARLNAMVPRFTADASALAHLRAYNTSGHARIPLVTLHTTGDDVVPFWDEIVYFFKVAAAGSPHVIQIPVEAYGHCNFSLGDMLGAFALLVYQASGSRVAGIEPTNPAAAYERFGNESRRHAAPTRPR